MRPADLALIAQTRADLKSGRAREAAGIHQGEVAAVVGVSRVAISQWEAGVTAPTTAHTLAYGRLLRDLARRAA